jgi:uncharacterized protein (TIGR00251 family)
MPEPNSPGGLPPYLTVRPEGLWLRVKAQPRASRNEIGEALGDELKIKVTAPPVDAAANQALVEFLVETLECSKGSVVLIKGQTSRHKVVWLKGMTPAHVAAHLAAGKT